MAKINKEQLIEDLLDTESNDFEGIVISALWEKYSTDNEVMYAEDFGDAMKEYLTEYLVNFIESAPTVK